MSEQKNKNQCCDTKSNQLCQEMFAKMGGGCTSQDGSVDCTKMFGMMKSMGKKSCDNDTNQNENSKSKCCDSDSDQNKNSGSKCC